MSDYTPTEMELRQAWVSRQAINGELTETSIIRGQAEFDRWLAAHDAEVAAKALRDAAIKFTEDFIDQVGGTGFPRVRVELLHAEADRILEAAGLSSGGEG